MKTTRKSKIGTREQLEALAQEAWDWLWADNLQRREEGHDFRGETYYLTATDLEKQIRSFIQEDLEGKKRGSRGRAAYGWTDVRISGLGPGGLAAFARSWLQHNYDLVSHNFGKGHCSGARFRPRGAPLSEAEQKTLEAQAKREKARKEGTIKVHLADGKGWPSSTKARCTRAQRETEKKKRRGYFGGRPSRSNTRTTSDIAKVTCPRCLKLIEEDKKNDSKSSS